MVTGSAAGVAVATEVTAAGGRWWSVVRRARRSVVVVARVLATVVVGASEVDRGDGAGASRDGLVGDRPARAVSGTVRGDGIRAADDQQAEGRPP